MKKNNLQQIRNITQKPWGSFYDFAENKGKWHLKALIIKKGQSLSLQKHNKRSELWIVVEGKIIVQKNKKKYTLSSQESIFIDKKEIHRIEAISDAVVIEVSFGNHDEADIIRFADNYGRIKI